MEMYVINVPIRRIIKAKQKKNRKYEARWVTVFLCLLFAWSAIIYSMDGNYKYIVYVDKVKYTTLAPVVAGTIVNGGIVVAQEDAQETYNVMSLDTSNSAEFTITAYCACSKCCGVWASKQGDVIKGAAGVPLIAGVSIAVDTDYIPLGTTLWDEAGNEYVAADTGSGVVGYWADIYMDDHQAAREVGKQSKVLYWGE